jgi:hypothetical protein
LNDDHRFDAGAREKEIGMLPIHWACANMAPADVVAAVLAAHRNGERVDGLGGGA